MHNTELDFNTKVLKDLKEEEIIRIYKEILEIRDNGEQNIKSTLLYKIAEELDKESFKTTVQEQLIRVELYCSMKLAEKYIREHHL